MSDSNPTDGHRHTPRLSLTPRLYERIQALGFVPGSAGVLSWLVEYAEELRRTIDALQGRPEGGADLGFALSSAGWVRAEGEALRSMALMALCAAQAHAETSPRAPLGAPEPRDPLPRWEPTPLKPPTPLPPRYACPRCGAGADTPKRCRPCGVKMARRRRE